MFEPNIPDGSTFVSVELDLFQVSITGSALIPLDISVGWLANDGTWNVQTSNTGWDDYAGNVDPATEPALHPSRDGSSSSDWVNNFPSFSLLTMTFGSNAPASSTAFSFGGGAGISPTFSDADFLTDAQDAFDDNEVNRTARGVPMAIVIVPEDAQAQQWAIASNENATVANRPELTIVYNPPAIASELSSTTSLDAEPSVTYGADSELSAQTTTDAAAELNLEADAELSAQATLDADSELSVESASELSAQAFLDADGVVVRTSASELSAQAAIDADAEMGLVAASELSAQATLDADAVVPESTGVEMVVTTTIDAALAINVVAEAELFAATTVDAFLRASETASDPQEVSYLASESSVTYGASELSVTSKATSSEVMHATDNVSVTAGSTNIEVTNTASTIEVGAE